MQPRDVICEGSDMNFKYTSSGQRLYQAPAAPVVFVVDGDEERAQRIGGADSFQPDGRRERLLRPKNSLRRSAPRRRVACSWSWQLPGSSGLELQRLVADRTDMPVIFMTSRADIQATVQAMKGGAFEFLIKPLVPEVLLDCDSRSPSNAAKQRDGISRRSRLSQERYESLSRREREVMSLLVRGRLEQAGRRRARHLRDHGEGPSRPDDAQDARRAPSPSS